jgi:gamma-glutamyltranspeptidase/glutathione hydrolase
MRRAYLDRARYLGDPDFSRIPVSRLTAKTHAREVATSIDSAHASRSADLGQDLLNRAVTNEANETTHYSVVDRQGLAVATTFTLEGSYGSHVVVNGAGFLLNNEMGDFNRKPGLTNDTGDIGTPANTIAPGKRMLSSMTPTIVAKDRKLVLVTGSPGGRTIINTVLTIVVGVTEYGLDGRAAVDLARMDHQWMPDRVSVEENKVPADVLEQLRAMGHQVRTVDRQGDAHSVWIGPAGEAYGVNDTRTADSKASVPALSEPSAKSPRRVEGLTAPSAGR